MSDSAPSIDLRPDHWAIVRGVLRRHIPDRRVLAFGSRATWTAKDYSDLDLAILGDDPLPLDAISAVAEGFGESDLPFKVDLVDWARIDEPLRSIIRRDGITVQAPIHYREAKESTQRSVLSCGKSINWQTVPLGSIIELTLSSVDKKISPLEERVLLCNYMDVYSQPFINTNQTFMTATAGENEIRRCRLQSGDVVITNDSEQYDDIGVPSPVRGAVPNLICGYHRTILHPLEDSVCGFYLYYALQTVGVQHQFHANSKGITRFGLRKDDILRVEVPLPPLP